MINSLYTAQSGLNTSKYSVDVTSNNIANENTEGYVKRVVNTSELSSLDDDIGNGVSFDGVTRTTSVYLYNQLVAQNSQASYYEQEDSILSNIEIMFSETEDTGFSTTLSEFFDSVESLRSDPNSLVYKNELSNQSELLVDGIKSLYTSLEESQDDTRSLLNDQVEEINTILQNIADLNEQMIQNNTTSNDLLDKRDALEKELSNYVNIEVGTGSSYSLKIGGVNAIFNNTNVYEVSIKEDTSINGDLNTSLTIYNNQLNLTSGSTKALTNELTTSSSNILAYKQSLDDFAKAFVETIDANSETSIFTGTDVSTLEFVSNNINDLTSDDLENLVQIQWNDEINVDSTTSNTSTFSEFFQNLLVSISSDVENNSNKLDSANAIVNSLESTYNELTKVDTDEEMVNLLQYQAAYEANAKIITAVDEMLQTLLDM